MRFLLILFCLSLIVLAILSYAFPPSWALNMVVTFQSHNNEQLIFFLQKLTDSISFISIGVPVLILLASEIKKDKSKRKQILVVLLCLALSGITSAIIKKTVKKPRPFETETRIEKLSGGGSYSFPSGHSTEAVTATIVMIYTFPYWYSWLFYVCWALAIMYSRMALGVHDIFDLIGGVITASGSVMLILLIESRFFKKKA